MSSSTEQRPHTTGPTPTAEETTVAIPRPTGPWTPPYYAPPAPHPTAHGRPAPSSWSMPPAGPGPIGPGTPTRPGMRWGWVVIAIVAAIAAVMLIGTVASNSRTMTVTGTVTVYGMSGYVSPGSSCTGSAVHGTSVTIYDASGDLVGATSLTGYGIARNTWSTSYYGYSDSCEYSFTMPDVAATGDYFRVKAGSGAGDGVGFSREQIESSGADITLR